MPYSSTYRGPWRTVSARLVLCSAGIVRRRENEEQSIHGGAQFHQSLIKRIHADKADPWIFKIQNKVDRKRGDQREGDGMEPVWAIRPGHFESRQDRTGQDQDADHGVNHEGAYADGGEKTGGAKIEHFVDGGNGITPKAENDRFSLRRQFSPERSRFTISRASRGGLEGPRVGDTFVMSRKPSTCRRK